jgi:hypothetical protein
MDLRAKIVHDEDRFSHPTPLGRSTNLCKRSIPVCSGDFEIRFKSDSDLQFFLHHKDFFHDNFALAGEVVWKTTKSQPLTLTGSYHAKTHGNKAFEYLQTAVNRIYNPKVTIFNPGLTSSPASVKVLSSGNACSPTSTSLTITQKITDPAVLVFVLKDATDSVIPCAWRVLSFNSSSSPEEITFFHQLAVGVGTISGTTVTTGEWMETNPADQWNFFNSAVNHFSPLCPITGDTITITNVTSGTSQDFFIGFNLVGGPTGTGPDVFDYHGVVENVTTSNCVFNTSNKAETLEVYCNLATTYTQGQVITGTLSSLFQIYSTNIFAWGSTQALTLTETSGVFTLS